MLSRALMQPDRDILRNPLDVDFEEYLSTVARTEREQAAFFAVEKVRFFPLCQECLLKRPECRMDAFEQLLQLKRQRVQDYPQLYSYLMSPTVLRVQKDKVHIVFHSNCLL